MPEARVVTFGCRLNFFESDVMASHLKAQGQRNVIVLNSCAVTREAERQVRQSIRRLKRENPQAKIVVTGCSAQLDPTTYARMPEVSLVLGNKEKMQQESFRKAGGVFVSGGVDVQEVLTTFPQPSKKGRAFLKIQDGCKHACTFCVITHARGESQSLPLGSLCQQAHHLLAAGTKEIVLTGVNVTSYGEDLPGPLTFVSMIKRLLLNVPSLTRLRLSSLDPADLGDDFIDLIAEEKRILPHFHLSLQAGADLILKRMKRRHLRHDVMTLCRRIREVRPEAMLGADVITGFPTETDAHFKDTLSLVEACTLSMLHVFPYSPRPGTPAARMPQVDRALATARSQKLRALGQDLLYHELKKQVGQPLRVLLEKKDFGHSDHFAPVVVQGAHEKDVGNEVWAQITDVQHVAGKWHLVGTTLGGQEKGSSHVV
ncbi:tRNA (N(6)-L-threonylcarbamoyladenosine(37)-C(2))-methylthiotransferase MtaB [Candidatus Hepatobacter penaei]|uniref:tRNA (N(6)-L-threonylcarbamoyladenosine(37)-C(2))- methylthiotransferase MtaB n=1 Tax=Candidatus Hepatobacter penaei TaxID=1274402 RepID=UPI0006984608|nr:tRNA (N(6)-L-threonylcarbamoyladenosine(37)-C(2))-methylthiotransferase MtaB [Candidatus Hepatobacter penaei]